MSKVDLKALEAQLMVRIDDTDLLEVKKIENLIGLYELNEKCDEAISKEGATITIENASQRFVKSHPSVNDKMKINAQIIALEKSIKFKMKAAPAPSATTVEAEKRPKLI